MTFLDLTLIALVLLAVVFAVRYVVRRKKRGQCVGCSCDCSNCSGCEKSK